MTDDMTIDHRMRMRRLQAAEMHGVMPETIEIVKEQNASGIIELSTFNWSAQLSSTSGKYLYLADLNGREIAVINRKQLSELIALLQKARAIMVKGSV